MSIIGYGYGGLLVAGGVMGYVKAKSIGSLLAGGGIGLGILALEYCARPKVTYGAAFSFAQATLSGLVAAYMFTSYTKSLQRLPPPAGVPRTLVLFAISAAAGLFFLRRATAPALKKQ